MYLIIFLICAFINANAVEKLAKDKGYKQGWWGVVGFFFGVFAFWNLIWSENKTENKN